MKGKVIGDILVLKKEVEDLRNLLSIPGVNRIVKLGRINGFKREPNVKILVGDDTETIHKENKCLFKLDVSKIMWSKGNTTERKRIANLVETGEIVVDMFAGIGYFSVPIAVHSNPKKIFSIEINPIAYNYLKENIKLNNVEGVIEPIFGDCFKVTPKNVADRVIMGFIGNTHYYLNIAIDALNNEGIIHYHETVPGKKRFKRPKKRLKDAAGDLDFEILNNRIIKKYSPGVFHVVIDTLIKK
jgi:tRNA wybutosine-synthesizing protein 2